MAAPDLIPDLNVSSTSRKGAGLPAYEGLVTPWHRQRVRYRSSVEKTAGSYEHVQDVIYQLTYRTALDYGEGDQLDIIGEWAGYSRFLMVPLENVYFSWDHLDEDGWDRGLWQDKYSASQALSRLDDESYRFLLRMMIAHNHWDGTRESAYEAWETIFPDHSFIMIDDAQDMSMKITFFGKIPATVPKMLAAGIVPFKPEGVRITSRIIYSEWPIFAWDTDSRAMKGWEQGGWIDAGSFDDIIRPQP